MQYNKGKTIAFFLILLLSVTGCGLDKAGQTAPESGTQEELPKDFSDGAYSTKNQGTEEENLASTAGTTAVSAAEAKSSVLQDTADTFPRETPEEAGIDPAAFEEIEDTIEEDIKNGFSSAQLAVIKDGCLIYQGAFGTVNSYMPDGTRKTDSPDVTNDTLYDLASNTKMYSVNYALQYLVSKEGFDIDTKVCDILGDSFYEDTIAISYTDEPKVTLACSKEWKSELTVRNLLQHQAGFPADPKYFRDYYCQETQDIEPVEKNALYSGAGADEATKKRTLECIYKTPLMYEPGTQTLYSDVDYMLLGFIIEKITGQSLQDYLKETFWNPMGLTHITYTPLKYGFSADTIAATELNGNTRDGVVTFPGIRTYTLQGEVHDEKAWYCMGGVSGHAGLFANATDLAILANLMLTGSYNGETYFTKDTISMFAGTGSGSASWGLGWWRQGNGKRSNYFSSYASEDTIGHQGWTGTLTLIDPKENLVIVYLTNKINTPVADPANDPNRFTGSSFTSGRLEFVPEAIYKNM